MGLSLLLQNTRELWKEWEMRLLVLLSLFLQLTLAIQVSQRKHKFRVWIHVMVWTAYTLADSITAVALGIFSNHLANIQDTKGTIDPKTQITAFWAPFLLLHLGGPDTITSFVMEDNELWLRQFLRLCVQAGLVGFICYMALSESTVLMLAVGMILVGLMKYAERVLCLYLASKGQLRESMLSSPNFVPFYPRIEEQAALKEEEGYQVKIEEVREVMAWEDFPVNSGQAFYKEKDAVLFKAYELFKVIKPLFLGLIRNFYDLEASKDMFMNSDMDSATAFRIMEIEFGFMYDLLHTKAPLLNCVWGIIRWVISLSVPCAVLVFFSFQDKKDYAKVDICITFLLISVAILLEIYSLLLAISSDWVNHWKLQKRGRSAISSALAVLQFCPNQRRLNSVAQISLLGLSFRKINRILPKYPMLAKLDEKLVFFYITYKEFHGKIKEQIFSHARNAVKRLEYNNRWKNMEPSLKLELGEELIRSRNAHLAWTVSDKEFHQIFLIWHMATELCYYKDRDERQGQSPGDVTSYKMSKLVSRYILYLMLVHPSMLPPTGIGGLLYKETLVDAQTFFEGEPEWMLRDEGSVSSVVIEWVRKLFKKENYFHTGVKSCSMGHRSRESRNLCELCHLLLQHKGNMCRGESRSVLFDACYLASLLNEIEREDFGRKWRLISRVWAKLLIYAARQCKYDEHCESLSRGGGELLSHIWLLMAHLGIAEAVETMKPQSAFELIKY